MRPIATPYSPDSLNVPSRRYISVPFCYLPTSFFLSGVAICKLWKISCHYFHY